MVGFKLFPDWKSDITVKYKMLTVVFSAYKYVEQRMATIAYPKISMSCSFVEDALSMQEILPSSIYIFPLYPFPHTGVKTGLKEITLSTTLQFFTNIVYLIDTLGNYGEISSIVGNVITLNSNWTGSASGLYYPAFRGNIVDVSREVVYRDVVSSNISIEEM